MDVGGQKENLSVAFLQLQGFTHGEELWAIGCVCVLDQTTMYMYTFRIAQTARTCRISCREGYLPEVSVD
jgi:hypothetical protein